MAPNNVPGGSTIRAQAKQDRAHAQVTSTSAGSNKGAGGTKTDGSSRNAKNGPDHAARVDKGVVKAVMASPMTVPW